MALEIVNYSKDWELRWDKFVMSNSVNGTFLQTRNFLNYHNDRFNDASILFTQGNNIVAVIPACSTISDGRKCFFSHKGSTFGGIIIDKSKYNITTMEEIFSLLESYLKEQGYGCVYMKNTSDIFSKENSELFDYYYYKNGYETIKELSFYIDCTKLKEDIVGTWVAGRRRDYKYSLKNDLIFKKLTTDEELKEFYLILEENLARHGTKPVHTVEELREFRDNRLSDIIDFYGIVFEDKLIAGTMLFYFGNEVLHTQYLAQKAEYTHLFTMNFLNYNLIRIAREKQFHYFSFGISTENKGKELNTGLAVFKEGFGTQFCNNKSYYKELI